MENNEFNVIDTNEPIESNNIENELSSVNVSYLDDNNEIIEPAVEEVIATPQVTVNDEGNVTSILFTDESDEKKAMPQFIFDENGTVVDVVYNNEPVVKEEETIMPVAPKFTFDENGIVTSVSLVGDTKEDNEVAINKVPKFTFDENGTVIAVSLDDKPEVKEENEDNNVFSKITFDENGTVTSVSFEDEKALENEEVVAPTITFDENGIVTSYSNEETIEPKLNFDEEGNLVSITSADEEVKEEAPTGISKEEEKLIADIEANRAKINEALEEYKKIENAARAVGIADNEYLVDTFEKVKSYDLAKDKFNEGVDGYIAGVNNSDVEENDTELSHMQF